MWAAHPDVQTMKRTVIVAALLAIVAVVGVSQFAWLRVWRARVVSDGSVTESARVYRNLAGDLLIDVRQVPDELYIVRGTAVGIPNRSSLVEFPPIVFARETRLRMVELRTDKAGSVDPRLSVTPQKVSFVIQNGRTIQVNWR